MYVYTCVDISAALPDKYVYTDVHIIVPMHIYVLYIGRQRERRVLVCVCVHVYLYMYAYVCICMYMYVYVICIYTWELLQLVDRSQDLRSGTCNSSDGYQRGSL